MTEMLDSLYQVLSCSREGSLSFKCSNIINVFTVEMTMHTAPLCVTHLLVIHECYFHKLLTLYLLLWTHKFGYSLFNMYCI